MSPAIGCVLTSNSTITRAMDESVYQLQEFTSPTGETFYAIENNYMNHEQLENWKNERLLSNLSGDLFEYAKTNGELNHTDELIRTNFARYLITQCRDAYNREKYNVEIPRSVWSELNKLNSQIRSQRKLENTNNSNILAMKMRKILGI